MPPILRAARLLLAVLCVVAPFLFVFSLPWIDLGVWRQVETSNVVLHTLAAGMALCLGMKLIMGDAPEIRNPVACAAAAIGLWGLACLPFVPEAALSFHGLPKHGFGVLWHLDFAVMIVGYASTTPTARKAAALSSALALGCILVLDTLKTGPYDFLEYLAFLGVFTGVSVAAVWKNRYGLIGSLAIAGLAIAQSGNKSGIVFALVVLGVFAIGRSRSWLPSPKITAGILAALALSWLALLPLCGKGVEWVALHRTSVNLTPQVLSVNPLDHTDVPSTPILGTLWNRAQMADVIYQNIAGQPRLLLTGLGFGTFPEVMSKERALVPGRRFATDEPTAARSYWDAQTKADFHSHNLFLEALNSGGVPALLLTVLLAVSPALFASPRHRTHAAILSGCLVVVGSFWFLVQIATPALALAVAIVTAGEPSPSGRLRRLAAIPFLAFALIALLSASMMMAVAKLEYVERHYYPLAANSPPDCRGITSLFVPERQINDVLYSSLFRAAGLQGNNMQGFLGERSVNLRDYSCTMRRYIDTKPSATILSDSLNARALLLSMPGLPPSDLQALDDDITHWRADIVTMLSIAPGRTDVLVPYVEQLAKGGPSERLSSVAGIIAPLPDSDPVKHWVAGRIAETGGDSKKGAVELNRALDLGMANLIPIAVDQAARIRGMSK